MILRCSSCGEGFRHDKAPTLTRCFLCAFAIYLERYAAFYLGKEVREL